MPVVVVSGVTETASKILASVPLGLSIFHTITLATARTRTTASWLQVQTDWDRWSALIPALRPSPILLAAPIVTDRVELRPVFNW